MFFDPGRIHVGLAVDEVALGQVILSIFRTSSVSTFPSMLHTNASYQNKREKSGDHKKPMPFLTLCSRYLHMSRNSKTLRQILQKLGGRMGYLCFMYFRVEFSVRLL